MLRLARVLLGAARRGSLGLLEESSVPMRVQLTDLDAQLHMNNGRYLSIMDLGRVDLAARTGLMKLWLSRRWLPVVGGATIRFRRALQPFERYELKTRLVSWDAKWLYIEQRFERHGETCAAAWIRAVLVHRGRPVPPPEMLAAHGVLSPPPPIPAALATWIESERLARAESSATRDAAAAPLEARLPN